jgi:hypothetical protein
MSYLISSLLAFIAGIRKEMKKKLLFVKKHINLKNSFVTVVFVLISITNVRAQFCNTTVASNETIVPSTTNQVTSIYNTGRRAFNFVATAGCTYYFETCGLSTSDTYLRLYATGIGGIGMNQLFAKLTYKVNKTVIPKSLKEAQVKQEFMLIYTWSC